MKENTKYVYATDNIISIKERCEVGGDTYKRNHLYKLCDITNVMCDLKRCQIEININNAQETNITLDFNTEEITSKVYDSIVKALDNHLDKQRSANNTDDKIEIGAQ